MLAQYIRACSPFRSCSLLLQLVPLLQPVPLIQHGETDGRVEEERSGALHVSQPAMDFVVRFAVTHAVTGTVTEK